MTSSHRFPTQFISFSNWINFASRRWTHRRELLLLFTVVECQHFNRTATQRNVEPRCTMWRKKDVLKGKSHFFLSFWFRCIITSFNAVASKDKTKWKRDEEKSGGSKWQKQERKARRENCAMKVFPQLRFSLDLIRHEIYFHFSFLLVESSRGNISQYIL